MASVVKRSSTSPGPSSINGSFPVQFPLNLEDAKP